LIRKKLLSYMLLCLGIFLLLTGFNTPTISIEKKIFVFMGNDKFAPYSFISDNRATGYTVDLVRILSAAINKDIIVKLVPWKKCMSSLEKNKIDGLIGLHIIRGAHKDLAYSTPIAKCDLAIFVENTNRYVNSLKSLDGTVVALSEGSLADYILKKKQTH
jgi:ABC-type amino acid transport substrate-binding protein